MFLLIVDVTFPHFLFPKKYHPSFLNSNPKWALSYYLNNMK